MITIHLSFAPTSWYHFLVSEKVVVPGRTEPGDPHPSVLDLLDVAKKTKHKGNRSFLRLPYIYICIYTNRLVYMYIHILHFRQLFS